MKYCFRVINDIIRGPQGIVLYTGNTGTYEFEFAFDAQWDGLQIFVSFAGNCGTFIVKTENNKVTVPAELLVLPGSCRFGVYGTNGSDNIKRMSSNLVNIEVVLGAYSEGTAPDIPTPDLWETLVTKTVPIIGENGNWWIWSIEEQGYIDSGVYASQVYDDTEVRQAIEKLNSAKVDKVEGKGLSTNDFTDEDKTKLGSLKNYDDSVLQQAIENINGEKEDKANKVMSISENSTDEQYPSAKAVYNADNALVLADERLKYYGDKDIVPSDESYFTVNKTGETITGLTDTGKTQTELVIPYKINGKLITNLYSGNAGTSILDGATDKITKVVIPNSVITIGKGAFSTCASLTSINIPDSVTSIEENAFDYCASLTSINIPDSVTSIKIGAFFHCTSLTSINIPNSITSISNYTFAYCPSLESIDITDSVTSIGSEAFYCCYSLTSVNIPNSVKSIRSDAFKYCTNFTIYCEQGSYAETYAKENNIPFVYTDVKAASINPNVKAALEEITTVNTIYDLGVQTELVITLPSGQVGDFIQVDFISGSTATTLTVNSSSGIVGFDLIPAANTIYTLYFDWGVTGYDGTEVTYGWRFNYSEYSIDVV